MQLPKLKKELAWEAREDRRNRAAQRYEKRRLATMRLWLAGYDLHDIAEVLGVSVERARQAQESGFRKVRDLMFGSSQRFRRLRVKPDDPWLAFARAVDLQLHVAEVLKNK